MCNWRRQLPTSSARILVNPNDVVYMKICVRSWVVASAHSQLSIGALLLHGRSHWCRSTCSTVSRPWGAITYRRRACSKAMHASMQASQQHGCNDTVTAPALTSVSAVPQVNVMDAVCIPPVQPGLGVRVEHFILEEGGLAPDVVAHALQQPRWFAERLIWFGAVYFSPVPPPPPGEPHGGGSRGGGSSSRAGGAKRLAVASEASGGPTAVAGSGRTEEAEECEVVQGAAASFISEESVRRIREARVTALARWGNGTDKQTPRRLTSPDPCGILTFHPDLTSLPLSQPTPAAAASCEVGVQVGTDPSSAADGGRSSRSGGSHNGLPWTDPASGWQVLVGGGYLRVHVHPKRFPAAHAVGGVHAWRARILGRGQGWWVVDKPAGMQVPPTVDNMRESLIACVEEAEGLAAGSLAPAHRLDTGTEGVVLLVQGAAAARAAAVLMRREGGANDGGTVRKTYRCLMLSPPPVGRVVHYAQLNMAERGAPRYTRILPGGGCVAECAATSGGDQPAPAMEPTMALPAAVAPADVPQVAAGTRPVDEAEGSGIIGAKRCELVVESVARVALVGEAAQQYGSHGYEATITLITGRTHQIRAQMAALGCPLAGDTLYAALLARTAAGGQPIPQPPLTQAGAAEAQPTGAEGREGVPAGEAAVPWHRAVKEDPLKPLCLQAWQLEVVGGSELMGPTPSVVFTAGDPWWRRE